MDKKKDQEILLLTLEMLKNNSLLRQNISSTLLQRSLRPNYPNIRITTVRRIIAALEELKIIAYIPTEEQVSFRWTYIATDEYLDEVIEKIKEAE